MYRGTRGRGRGSGFDRRVIEAQLIKRDREEMERMQKEEMERMQREKELATKRGMPTNRGRGPGRWNTAGERLNMLAASEVPVPEYVPLVAAVEPAPAPAPEPAPELSQEERVREHMRYMEGLRRRRPPLPPQYTDPSDYYKNYHVSNTAKNFPIGHNYTEPAAARPAITLSPEAQAYEESQKKLADELESWEKGWGGGRKQRKTTSSIRQKKQRRHRHRRRSTKKYRK